MDGFNETQGLVFDDSLQRLISDVLIWIGFGTVVGLVAKAIMPGRDPGGALATLLMGIGGTVMGCGVLSFFRGGERVVPVSPLGFFAGVAGTLLVLFLYKLLGEHYFVDGEYVTRNHRRHRGRGRRRKLHSAIYED